VELFDTLGKVSLDGVQLDRLSHGAWRMAPDDATCAL